MVQRRLIQNSGNLRLKFFRLRHRQQRVLFLADIYRVAVAVERKTWILPLEPGLRWGHSTWFCRRGLYSSFPVTECLSRLSSQANRPKPALVFHISLLD